MSSDRACLRALTAPHIVRLAILLLLMVTAPGAGEERLAGNLASSTADPRDRLAVEEAKLRLLTEKLSSLKRELASLGERQTTLLGELHRLEIQIELAERELELLKLRLERGYREIDANLRQIQALEKSIRELRPYLARRAVALYKLGRLSYLRLLLSVEQPRDLTRAYRYISRLARADAEKTERFRADQRDLEESKAQLLARTRDMLETRRGLEKTRQVLERSRTLKAALLEEVDKRREMAQSLLHELEEARENLGRLVASLAVGEQVSAERVFLPIRLYRGQLDWPVDGRLGSRFGKQLHPRFRTVTLQNGIEIESPLGAAVRALYDGRVVFASWFKGYGNLLIISHPSKVHSLYGHLSEIRVAEGSTVVRGQEIALVGDTGSLSGPGLYFEVREEGKPVDPEEWLAPPPRQEAGPQTP